MNNRHMLVIFDPITGTLVAYNHQMLMGYVDVYKHETTEEQIQAVRDSGALMRDVIANENEVIQAGFDVQAEPSPSVEHVYAAFIAENGGYNPRLHSVFADEEKAVQWLRQKPWVIGIDESSAWYIECWKVSE